MIKSILTLTTLLFLKQFVVAQNETDRALIIKQTNTDALNSFIVKTNSQYFHFLDSALKKGIQTEILDSKNRVCYLSGFDKYGKPVYDFDYNVNAAITGRVDKIWENGESGLDLDGTGIEIGHWEAGGLARIDHQEYSGRITHAETEPTTSHATHTAGTMIAVGIDSNARGMASNASIVSRRSNNDESEMASFAAAGGILSNHSYGSANPNGNTPLYGYYNSHSQEWDEVTYLAPYLSVCKAAGNTRNDGVNTGDNGYDVMYTTALAKNIITVGAVNDVPEYISPLSVSQSVFSSWGPTDDWRIKPDLVANGVNVYSSDFNSNADYRTTSGTSMATPCVTGAIALLQQHYHNDTNTYMKAATVKALLIATTDEAGNDVGPDFQNGWGLLNAERAAQVISTRDSASRIDELTLTDNETYTTTFNVDGTKSLELVIAWTDPAGTISAVSTDNLEPKLVNDLDVRITKDSEVYEPWQLTPNSNSNNFSDPATPGDNYRDNVERIDISSLPEGEYTVTVSHKGNLENGYQDFSMVINGIIFPIIDPGVSNITIYPNPSSSGVINIAIPYEMEFEECNIHIYDMLGKIIRSENLSDHQFNINTSSIASGSYVIKMYINDTIFEQKVIIDNRK